LTPALRFKVIAAAILLPIMASGIASALEEKPLDGDRYDQLADHFNQVAQQVGVDLRLVRDNCTSETCTYSFAGGLSGNAEAIDDGDPMLKTITFVHRCSAADAAVLRDAARVFVKLFGEGDDNQDAELLDELGEHISQQDDRKSVVTIDGVEFTNSGTSCTLLVARPQPQQRELRPPEALLLFSSSSG
jgi:hypothetical protein